MSHAEGKGECFQKEINLCGLRHVWFWTHQEKTSHYLTWKPPLHLPVPSSPVLPPEESTNGETKVLLVPLCESAETRRRKAFESQQTPGTVSLAIYKKGLLGGLWYFSSNGWCFIGVRAGGEEEGWAGGPERKAHHRAAILHNSRLMPTHREERSHYL